MLDSYGGFWRRTLAFLIDQVVLNIIYLLLLFAGVLSRFLGQAAGGFFRPGAGTGGGPADFSLLYTLAVVVATVLYFTYFVGASGQTPGKMLLGLRVIQASGEPMTPGIAFLRWVGYLISGLVFCLGFLWVAFDGRKQGWHDKIAATIVVRERREDDRVDREPVPPAFTFPAIPPQTGDRPEPAGEIVSGASGNEPSDEPQKMADSSPERPQETPSPEGSRPIP